ncbi:hypothetical protein Leryth_026829 [Lithospermum erythrorhizon]|nr:hypothetical protein Leryth_026829 [Lithospermum erythrorhizon]
MIYYIMKVINRMTYGRREQTCKSLYKSQEVNLNVDLMYLIFMSYDYLLVKYIKNPCL